MATTKVGVPYTSGNVLYAAVYRASDSKVFDWSDNTWKLVASATTPNVSLTEGQAYGSGQKMYYGEINLSTINGTLVPVDVTVTIFRRVGGSVSLTADAAVTQAFPMTILAGEIATGSELGQMFFCDVTANYTTTLGTAMHFSVCLKTLDGRLVSLETIDAAATCSIVVTRDPDSTGSDRTPQFTLNTATCGSVNADHYFQVQYSNPNLTANRGYVATATITTGGQTYLGDAKFNT